MAKTLTNPEVASAPSDVVETKSLVPKNLHIPGVRRSKREDFDRERDFVSMKDFSCNGKSQASGKPFDKTQVTTRRLRQLYDGRFITMTPESSSPLKGKVSVDLNNPVKPEKPEFKTLSSDGLKQWLRINNVTVPPRTSRTKLLVMVDARWEELVNGIVNPDGTSKPDSPGVQREPSGGDAST